MGGLAEILQAETDFLKQPVFARQVHGNDINYVLQSGLPDTCDGLYTDRTGLGLGIKTADCAAVMIFDSKNRKIMNLHVGWRGAQAKIIEKAFSILYHHVGSNSNQIWVSVSPMIRSCCYEVGSEFYDYFPQKYLRPLDNKVYFDLPGIIETQIKDGGILRSQIEISNECTCCSSMKLPSFRRDKTKNRIINIIELKEI
jgi:YfiH family protein